MNINNTKIFNNSAIDGGGLIWNYVEPIIDNLGSLYNNSAQSYGDNIASFARELIVIEDSEVYLSYFNRSTKSIVANIVPFTSYIFDNVQSGDFIPIIYLGVIDKYGQIV